MSEVKPQIMIIEDEEAISLLEQKYLAKAEMRRMQYPEELIDEANRLFPDENGIK